MQRYSACCWCVLCHCSRTGGSSIVPGTTSVFFMGCAGADCQKQLEEQPLHTNSAGCIACTSRCCSEQLLRHMLQAMAAAAFATAPTGVPACVMMSMAAATAAALASTATSLPLRGHPQEPHPSRRGAPPTSLAATPRPALMAPTSPGGLVPCGRTCMGRPGGV